MRFHQVAGGGHLLPRAGHLHQLRAVGLIPICAVYLAEILPVLDLQHRSVGGKHIVARVETYVILPSQVSQQVGSGAGDAGNGDTWGGDV